MDGRVGALLIFLPAVNLSLSLSLSLSRMLYSIERPHGPYSRKFKSILLTYERLFVPSWFTTAATSAFVGILLFG